MNVQLPISNKKEAIFRSTLALIRDYGFHGCPMSRIAQDAEVAIGTIYHYFDSKDELILELYKYNSEQIQQAIMAEYNPNDLYIERLFTLWHNLVWHYIRFPDVLSFMEQFYSSPFPKMICTEKGVTLQDQISFLIQEGIDAGHLKNIDINILSSAFIGTVIATAKRHTHSHFKFDKQQMQQMMGVIWDGIRINQKDDKTII